MHNTEGQMDKSVNRQLIEDNRADLMGHCNMSVQAAGVKPERRTCAGDGHFTHNPPCFISDSGGGGSHLSACGSDSSTRLMPRLDRTPTYGLSCGIRNSSASPLWPMRAVRPTRCT